MNIPVPAVVSVFAIATPAGGAVIGGTSPVTYYITTPLTHTPTGGVRVSGAAYDPSHIPSGGMRIGGAATVSSIAVNIYDINSEFAPTERRGVTISGDPLISDRIAYVPSGGVVLGGESTIAERIPYTPTGGVVAGGAAAVMYESKITPVGGVLMSGAGVVKFVAKHAPEGGVVLSGEATTADRQAFHLPDGGVVLGGSATAYSVPYGTTGPTTENPTNAPYPSWAINADTFAPSRYTDFIANSFAQYRGTTYIANAGGIYAVDGATDATREIAAHITLPKLDFNTTYNKKVPNIYVGAKLAGNNPRMKVRVTVNKLSPLYYEFNDNRAKTDAIRGLRTTTGKALEGRYWQFRIDNINGTDFEIDSLELRPMITSRHGA